MHKCALSTAKYGKSIFLIFCYFHKSLNDNLKYFTIKCQHDIYKQNDCTALHYYKSRIVVEYWKIKYLNVSWLPLTIWAYYFYICVYFPSLLKKDLLASSLVFPTSLGAIPQSFLLPAKKFKYCQNELNHLVIYQVNFFFQFIAKWPFN